VKVRILPSGSSGNHLQYLSSFVINDAVSIDAGCIGLGELADQEPVNHVLITHTHSDHLGSLPMFLENRDGNPRQIYGHPFVLETLKTDVFNGRIWPDLLGGDPRTGQTVTLVPLEPEEPVLCAGLRITPVGVNHIVPTLGFIVEDDDATVVFGSDSGPTERIWKLARARPNLKAVFIETSFPDRMTERAIATGHLTPQLLRTEAGKLPEHVSKIVVHMKPLYYEQIMADLASLQMSNLTVGSGGKTYTF
jgi:cAMP phosphodiesterase